MDLHPDFRDLLAEFAREKVSYAVVGGYAVGHHAKPRATKDIDLLVSPSGDNLERVGRALVRFGAAPNVVAAARKLAPTEIVYLGIPPVRVDILRSADGIDDVDATLARAVPATLGDLTVPILALDDLIANKRAAGRAQDLADLALLEKVRRRK
jgi:Nucleotidyl transferase AbiEii toxin, Type IV TA system